jgi:hypothetical protein
MQAAVRHGISALNGTEFLDYAEFFAAPLAGAVVISGPPLLPRCVMMPLMSAIFSFIPPENCAHRKSVFQDLRDLLDKVVPTFLLSGSER